jgi:hypothetical protein
VANINDVVGESDNCSGIPTITFVGDVTSGQTCANRFTVTRTYRATDACGNSATCSQTITVNDQTPPSLTCPGPVSVSCASQVPVVNINDVVGETDNCGGSVTVTHVGDVATAQTCVNRFILTRTYRATDVCGNSATCSQVITVNDQIAPTLTVPANTTLDCYAVPAPGMAMATDNCGGNVTVVYLGQTQSDATCPILYRLTRVWRATDACGNSTTASQVITVTDIFAPLITKKPKNLLVECSADNQTQLQDYLNNNGGTEATDCSTITWSYIELSSYDGCGNTFGKRFRFIATDECGNSSYADGGFTVVDQTPPVFEILPQDMDMAYVPGDMCLTAFSDWLEKNGGAVVSDNCGEVKLTHYLIFDSMGCGGQWFRTVKFVATDECLNMAMATASFNIVDQTIPTNLPIPDTIFVDCPEDVPNTSQIPYIFGDYFYDDCGVIFNITYVEYVTYCGIARTFIFNVTDPSGNSTISYQVTFVPLDGLCDPLCTATQDVWGDDAASIGSMNVGDVIDAYFQQYNDLRAGKPGRQLVIDDPDCLGELLPGSGEPKVLPAGESITDDNCDLPSSLLTPTGALNNLLAANVIAMKLNMKANYDLNGRLLGMTHVWYASSCLIPPSVQLALGQDKSIYHLLGLADSYLAKQGNTSTAYANDLLTALSNINSMYENCVVTDPCADKKDRSSKPGDAALEIFIVPNPATDFANLYLGALQDGGVQITIFDASMRMYRQIDGTVQAGFNQFSIDLSDLPTGIYTISVLHGGGLKTLRLAKATR